MKSVNAARFLCLNFAVVCGMVALPAVADTTTPQPPLELTGANLERVLDPPMADWIDKRKGPGAVVVVVRRDGPIFAKGYGFADIAAKKPFTADTTLVRPGSISKLFTAIAVMQLVDTGQLDLDRDVNGYIDFAIPTPEGGVPVTLRRLLTHRGGFEDHLKGLFSKDREPQPLGLQNTCPSACFLKAISRLIPIMASPWPAMSSNALRENPSPVMCSDTFSIHSVCAIPRSASRCRRISRH